MSNIYYLKNSNDPISFSVQIGTIGNPAIVASIKRTGNTYVKVPAVQGVDFNIPNTALGASADLIGSVLLITSMIAFTATDDLEQAFANLSITITLTGGLDGPQNFVLLDADKTEFANTNSIVASQVVKLQTNQ
jgi:hypothetical protein